MIDKQYFEQKIEDTVELMGTRMSKKQRDLIYDRIKFNYTNDDLDVALYMLVEQSDKFNFIILRKYLDAQATQRREEEVKKAKEKEEQEARRFWSNNYVDPTKCNRDCINCKVMVCSNISNDAKQAIKKLLSGDKTLQQVNQELSAKYKGWDANFEVEPF